MHRRLMFGFVAILVAWWGVAHGDQLGGQAGGPPYTWQQYPNALTDCREAGSQNIGGLDATWRRLSAADIERMHRENARQLISCELCRDGKSSMCLVANSPKQSPAAPAGANGCSGVIPAARAAGSAIEGGSTAPGPMMDLNRALRNCPPSWPRPIHCWDMMVDAMSKIRTKPAYSRQRARQAVECYERDAGSIAPSPGPQRPEVPHLPWEQPAEAAGRNEMGTANLPGIGTKPCVTANDFTTADEAVNDLPQTSKTGSDSFNCFYYIRTVFEGERPKNLSLLTATGLTTNLSPATTYIDDRYLGAHNYQLLWQRTTIISDRDFYQPGDIILVPGQDNSEIGRLLAAQQEYIHAAVVLGVRNGRITRIRQKIDPFICIVDLTPEEFESVYKPESVNGRPAAYSIWRRQILTVK